MKIEKQHFVYHSDNRFTLVGIVDNVRENVAELKLGLAVCRDGDQFSRKMGRIIAYGRAEKKPFDVVVNVPEDRITDLFYSGAVQMAEERVNEINARQWRANDTVNKYIKEWEGTDNREKLKGMKVDHLLGFKTSMSDYDFIK